MDKNKAKQQKSIRRQARVRSQISGTAACPRLNVFRSNRGMFLQLIDDLSGRTLASASSQEVKAQGKKTEISKELGILIAKKAKEAGIAKVVFDRSSYRYHGRVQAAAEGARQGGLEF